MTKQEAIRAMEFGEKVTHRFFEPLVWFTIDENSDIITEESYASSAEEFWNFRKSIQWETGWSIWGS